jgi:hypothetical protein
MTMTEQMPAKPRVRRRTPLRAAPLPTAAIQGYDSLTVAQVLPHLAELNRPALEAVLALESAGKGRVTILRRAEALLARSEDASEVGWLAPAPVEEIPSPAPVAAAPLPPPPPPSQGWLREEQMFASPAPPPPPSWPVDITAVVARPRRVWWQKTWVRVSAAAVVVLMVIGALAPDEERTTLASASGAESSEQSVATEPVGQAPVTPDVAPPTTEAPTTTTTRPKPTTTTTIDAVAAKRDAMGSWAADNVDSVDGVLSALDDAGTAATLGDPLALAIACADLSSALGPMRQAVPTPDDQLTNHLSAALRYFESAADLCIEGASTYDGDLLMESAGYLELAAEEMGLATDRLNELM